MPAAPFRSREREIDVIGRRAASNSCYLPLTGADGIPCSLTIAGTIKKAGSPKRAGFLFALAAGLNNRARSSANRSCVELATEADLVELERSPFKVDTGGSGTASRRTASRGTTSRSGTARDSAARRASRSAGRSAVRFAAANVLATATVAVTAMMTTMVATAVATATITIARRTAIAATAVAGNCRLLTADQGDADDRDKHRDAKQKNTIHPRILQLRNLA